MTSGRSLYIYSDRFPVWPIDRQDRATEELQLICRSGSQSLSSRLLGENKHDATPWQHLGSWHHVSGMLLLTILFHAPI